MAKMTDRELLALVDAEFSSAMGAPGGDISDERAKAWDYYLSKKLGNEITGQSEVVTSDVSDVVDSILPSLMRIFTMADNVVIFDPVGPEDVAAAEQASDYVSHVFFKQNPSFEIMYTWSFDALVQKNGIVKAWWDESEVVTTESYEGLSDEELAELLDDEELEPIEQAEREEDAPQIVATPQGPAQVILPAKVHDVTFRRVSKSGRARVEPVPPEEYRISKDARSLDPSRARMVGQERPITRSELLEMGFDEDIVDDLPAHGDAQNSDEDIARRDKSDETGDAPHDRSQDEILVREAYIRVDFDGDGRSELRQVFTAGNEVLSNEPADRQPFHIISPQPLPHKHFGRATAEKVMDVQEVQTTLLRQVLVNLYHSNNPGHAVWEQGIGENTLDDLLTTQAGRIARFSRPVADSWAPMVIPFTAGQTFPMLEFFDKVKRDRTGISSDAQGLSPDALKNIQTSVLAQAIDVSKMKVELIARIFAETGIKSLFLHLHELLLKHQQKAKVVRLRNKWVSVDPRQWRTRMDMTVNVGLGIGTREQNLLHLNAIWEKQKEIATSGGLGILVSPKNLFNTAAELVKNANLKHAEMFFTDPGEGQIPQQGDQAAQQQAALVQAQLQLAAQELSLQSEKNTLAHQRELERLRLDREAESNRLAIEFEKIANALTEMELKFATNVPGARV